MFLSKMAFMVSVLIIIGAIALVVLFNKNVQSSTTSNASMVCGGITNDPATWPTGDSIWNVCQAIALAEGAEIAGSNPDRLNNPGDISDGATTYGFENHSGSAITTFPDKPTGWNALYNKIKNAFVDRQSSVYSPDMTWQEFAQTYAGDSENWMNNVTSQLGVKSTDAVGDYFVTQ